MTDTEKRIKELVEIASKEGPLDDADLETIAGQFLLFALKANRTVRAREFVQRNNQAFDLLYAKGEGLRSVVWAFHKAGLLLNRQEFENVDRIYRELRGDKKIARLREALNPAIDTKEPLN